MNESSGADHVRQGMDYGETSDVHEVHSAIQREKREPRAGRCHGRTPLVPDPEPAPDGESRHRSLPQSALTPHISR